MPFSGDFLWQKKTRRPTVFEVGLISREQDLRLLTKFSIALVALALLLSCIKFP